MDLSKITTYQAGVALSSAYRNMNKLFSEMLSENNLTSMQWFVIGTIKDSGPDGIQLTKLACKLQTGLPFITNTVNMLVSKKMVERRDSKTDNRSKCVYITAHFLAECEQIEISLRTQLVKSVYAKIKPNDLKIWMKVLTQIAEIDKAQ